MDGLLPAATLPLLVRQIRFEASGVNSYELVDPNGHELPPATAGSHIDVHLGGGLTRQYSLCGDPADRRRYVVAVLREDAGSGGSRRLHETLRVQDLVSVGLPRNNFALAAGAERHLLVGGGIGITPLKTMAHTLAAAGADFRLHYCARSPEHAAFRDELIALGGEGRVAFHYDGGNTADGLDIAALLRTQDAGTHLYYCGPPGFMAACAAAAAHWPVGTVHCEHFKAPAATPAPAAGLDVHAIETASVEIASTSLRLAIPPGVAVIDVLHEAGIMVETSCVSGLCGSCRVRYLSGEVDHQDYILSEDDRAEYLTTCVSRPKAGVLVLDL